jgi:conjugative transfer region protein TrbK
MLGRSEIFRAAAIVALVAVFIATLVAVNRRPPTPVVETAPTIVNPASDDLSAELRRCSALGPQDAEDPHCVAVWEENRQRFFGRPARPLSPQTPPGAAAPATPFKGDAR